MESLIPEFLKLGWPGIVIALMIAIVIERQARVRDLEKQNAELTKLVLVEADKRANDNRGQDEVIRGSMTAMHNLAEQQRATQTAVNVLSERTLHLDQSVQQIIGRRRG